MEGMREDVERLALGLRENADVDMLALVCWRHNSLCCRSPRGGTLSSVYPYLAFSCYAIPCHMLPYILNFQLHLHAGTK